LDLLEMFVRVNIDLVRKALRKRIRPLILIFGFGGRLRLGGVSVESLFEVIDDRSKFLINALSDGDSRGLYSFVKCLTSGIDDAVPTFPDIFRSTLTTLTHVASNVFWLGLERIRISRFDDIHGLVCIAIRLFDQGCKTDLKRFCILVGGPRQAYGSRIGRACVWIG